ncbi:MAG: Diaminopimelate epimerase [Pelotomaculum sp. PtaU1.Bin035]|nr:MAG: Diaminopimelate epimerase [Pelotomaculum sp. PtaU1.Bin035]
MNFTKVQGLGNDFILINCFKEEVNPRDFPWLAAKMCDRHFGIGADGLVPLLPSNTADINMRIFNSDGSEAEMCGNVIRCAAKYCYEHGIVNKDKIRVETLAGIIVPELIIENSRVRLVRVDMGEPRLDRSEIPMEGPPGRVIDELLEVGGVAYRVTAVSMGNPHCVIFVPDIDLVPMHVAGPQLEIHHVFPRKTNVEFVQVLNRKEIKMKVWERGAGETMACGTGACATVVACVLNGHTERRVTVRLKAGDLLIEWEADNRIYMTGPAEEVFTGYYPY